jgi:hypothetical protein
MQADCKSTRRVKHPPIVSGRPQRHICAPCRSHILPDMGGATVSMPSGPVKFTRTERLSTAVCCCCSPALEIGDHANGSFRFASQCSALDRPLRSC